ncbi:MAG: oxidoreductase [Paenibacillus sp.]|jgi:predicted dehydrogenase|nr:oxidoreductase [Paenibacillus sp.]
MKIQFGIWGCSHAHITMFIEEMLALGHTCAGLYEPEDKAMAERVVNKYGIPLLTSREALLDPAITVIGSGAINSEKIEIVEWCERHGKHIMLDKPAVVDRGQLARLEAVIARGRIQVGMLLTERFRPALYTLKRAIEAGELGRLVSITVRKPHRLNPSSRGAWHFAKDRNGGIVIDLLVHDYDLLRWLTGQEIVSMQTVVAKNELPEYPEFWDTASSQVIMDGGVIGQMYTDWHIPDKSWTWGDSRLFVNGTIGFAELRLCGDPSVSDDGELYLQVSDSSPLAQVELAEPPLTLTADFLQRLASGACDSGALPQADILAACALTVAADETAVRLNNL